MRTGSFEQIALMCVCISLHTLVFIMAVTMLPLIPLGLPEVLLSYVLSYPATYFCGHLAYRTFKGLGGGR